MMSLTVAEFLSWKNKMMQLLDQEGIEYYGEVRNIKIGITITIDFVCDVGTTCCVSGSHVICWVFGVSNKIS